MNTRKITLLAVLAATACTIVSAQDRPDSDQPPSDSRGRRVEERQHLRIADDRGPADSAREARPDGERVRPPSDRRDDRARPERREDGPPPPPRGPRGDFGPGPRHFHRYPGEFRGPGFHRPMPEMGTLTRRVYHVERAIKHLRAAGLDDMADRLEERLHQAERSFGAPRPPERRDQDGARPRPEPRRDDEPRERR